MFFKRKRKTITEDEMKFFNELMENSKLQYNFNKRGTLIFVVGQGLFSLVEKRGWY